MNICFEIEIHIYAKEISCDELLDENNPSYGIFGPSIMHSLRRNRFCQIHYQINDDSTLGDVTQAIIDRVTEGMEEDYVIRETDIAFLYGDNRYFIGNPDANMSILISQYLDPYMTSEIRVQVLVSANAGSVYQGDGIRYFMHSHEAGRHNEPHVHVCDTGGTYNASLSLSDGHVLAGNFPSRLQRKAKRVILEKQAYFYQCWQAKTDGLLPDINHYFGFLQY